MEDLVTYGDFEKHVLEDVCTKNDYVVNFICGDKFTNSVSVDRISINVKDGYVENTLFQSEYLPEPVDKFRQFRIDSFGQSVSDIALPDHKVGLVNYFFDTNERFDDMYGELVGTDTFVLKDVNNPQLREVMFNRVYNTLCFKDPDSFANANGLMRENVRLTYFSLLYYTHEVINSLLPESITIIADSDNGINIVDYKCMLGGDPKSMIYDFNNKVKHIYDVLKELVCSSNSYISIGQFHLKLTITPVIVSINITLKSTGSRLMIATPVVGKRHIINQMSPAPDDYANRRSWKYGRDITGSLDIYNHMQGDFISQMYGYENENDEYRVLFGNTPPMTMDSEIPF